MMQQDWSLAEFYDAFKGCQHSHQLEAAAALVQAAAERHAGEPRLVRAFAQAPTAGKDWQELADRAEFLRVVFPEQPLGYTSGLTALRHLKYHEAEQALLHQALTRFPCDLSVAIEESLSKTARCNWNEAARIWQDFRLRFPQAPGGYVHDAHAMLRAGRLQEARNLIEAAIITFPANEAVVVLRATIADRLGDPATAAQHWAAAIAVAPEHPQVQARRQLAASSGPQEVAARRAAAQEALKRHDWNALDKLAAALRQIDPLDVQAIYWGAWAARQMDQADRAEQILATAPPEWADQPEMLVHRAYCRMALRDWESSIPFWSRLREVDPTSVTGYAMGNHALLQVGRLDEAETLIQEGLIRFPAVEPLLVQSALTATRRGDLVAAQPRWEAARAVFPNNIEVRNSAGALRLMASELDGTSDASALIAEPAANDEAKRLVLGFESLGGNCEFGLIQRIAGAEPLGLLRFATNSTAQLIEMLECRLEGVGSEAQTELVLQWHKEYFLTDKRFFATHTWLSIGRDDPELLYRRMLRRTIFLRDKLMSDLADAEKIFVYRAASGLLTEDEVLRLHGAVSAFGSPTLFCVRDARPGEPSGTVERRGPRLLVGILPAYPFFEALSLDRAQSRYEPWLDLCRQAIASVGVRTLINASNPVQPIEGQTDEAYQSRVTP